jgi:hypothetical protein
MPFFGMAFEGHNLPFFGKIRDKPSKRFKLFWSYGKCLYGGLHFTLALLLLFV